MNFVLIHGGFHGGWCWRLVAARLRAQGHAVTHPTHTGMGERRHLLRPDLSLDTFIDDLVNHLETEELADVVLVGHSFGGLSISGAADRVPHRIRHLVYLDSLIIQPGQTLSLHFDMTDLVGDNTWRLQQVPTIPEPGTYALWMAGLAGMGLLVRRRR